MVGMLPKVVFSKHSMHRLRYSSWMAYIDCHRLEIKVVSPLLW